MELTLEGIVFSFLFLCPAVVPCTHQQTEADPKHIKLRSVQVRIQANVKRQGMADSAEAQARRCNAAGLCARRVRFRLSKWWLPTLCIFAVCMLLFRHAVMADLSRAEDPELGGRLKTAESLRDAP